MKRIAVLAVWIVFAVAAGLAAEPQSVTFSSGSETVGGYLAVPGSPGKHPALLVLHEDEGLTNWVKEQARKLAGQGYVALAPDLYRGQVAYDPSLAYELMVATPEDRALRDMEAAINFLSSRTDVNKDKIGAIGWSAGGRWALLLAVHDPLVAACVVNYSSMPTDPADIQKIHAAVLGIFGSDDRDVPAGDVDAFVSAMDNAHKSIHVKIYQHVGHGFEDSDLKLGYRETAADDAWERTIAFLDQHLK